MDIRFTYYKCQACTAKVHCAQCDIELAEMLEAESAISWATVSIPQKTMSLQTELDRDSLEEILEDVGVFMS